MFSEIPKLFDKNFAVGYLIPSIVLLLGFQTLLYAFGITYLPPYLTMDNPVVGSAVIVVLGWLVGIVLAATNRDLIRFLEGYGRLNPLRVFLPRERARFRRLAERIWELEDKYPNRTDLEKDELNRLSQEQVMNFPDQEKWVLPTSFGNAIRAFEVYPRLMYGVDSIALWPRLLTVIPAEYKVYIDDAKAPMDFWLNMGISLFVLLLSSLGMWVYDLRMGIEVHYLPFVLLLIAEVLLILLCLYRARRSAIGWGQTVKSAFDVYLPDLAAKVGLKLPDTREERRIMWEKYGVALLYARWDVLPELAKPEDTKETKHEGLLAWIIRLLTGG